MFKVECFQIILNTLTPDFQALTMSTVVLVSMCRYSIHMIDLRPFCSCVRMQNRQRKESLKNKEKAAFLLGAPRLENGWPAKSAWLLAGFATFCVSVFIGDWSVYHFQVCLFYVDLIHDVVSMTLFLAHAWDVHCWVFSSLHHGNPSRAEAGWSWPRKGLQLL